jgi:hypothetical protein
MSSFCERLAGARKPATKRSQRREAMISVGASSSDSNASTLEEGRTHSVRSP